MAVTAVGLLVEEAVAAVIASKGTGEWREYAEAEDAIEIR